MSTELTRTIEVEREGWSIDCCGAPFAVGDRVTWALASLPARGALPARYLEERHAPTLPVLEVSGVVRAIASSEALRTVLVIGENVLTSDRSERRLRRLDTWDRSSGGVSLLVGLEIDADAVLPPPYVAPEPAVRDAVPPPPAGVVSALHGLLEQIHSEYGERVRIRSVERGRKASVLPAADGAGELHWATGPKTIVVNLGYDRVILPADAEGVARLAALADEVARGVVRHQPPPVGQGVRVVFGRRRSLPTSAW